ncbi:mediator of DNA damage checkpoint 1, transcript variant X4 [Ictidomys tridecemlineatus]|uniref:mediator of DNA damage checkpoint protein 1 isoform X3 n=1 Tax=Ictidomys tridecemlineatus TaxID=43179 RepID=UPI000B53E386|nr:mediator of DNA damage checkpoint protein 1 isoform X3 [Ictidomys tridecemlineatus]KAG3289009.1 mediator of DNA damage checkpoint 1, transcript variant X4 [Ictidomys tridecemlineatus]
MEDTQAVDWDVEEEEETEQSNESSGYILEPIGRLHIFSGAHGPEKDFPLFLGKNVIGRLPDCSVTLPFPSISKQHAVIEISAWNKAPVLQDCGSLNGTQILRPPKVLSPGLSHRLRDQELILFADLPCQYHRLDVRPPYVSRGPLTVEATPKVQEEPQPSRLPLAEDSEEEEDFSKGCVVKESRTTSSSLATVVPESDEEGPSLAPGDSFAFNLDSDTDEEEGQQPAAREASSAARKCAAAEAEQPEASGITTDMWLGKVQPPGEIDKDTKVKRDTGNRVVPVGLILERSQLPEDSSDTDVDEENRPPGKTAEAHLERVQPSGFLDSDTDVEEEGIPATPAVVPMKKRQVFHGVGTRSPATLGSAHLQESPAGSDTDMEEGEAPLAIPLERSQTSMVIDSDTDDEEEVSAALTLARLKESGAVLWNRNADIEKDRVQPVLLQKKSLTTSERDSDTDMEEGLPVEKRETVLNGHTDKEETLVIANSENGQTPLRDNDVGEEADMSSPGVLLERSQAASTTGNINIEVKQEVPSGPAVICWGKHQVLVKGTNQTDKEAKQESAKLPIMPLEAVQSSDEDGETDMEVGMSSEVADVRKSQLLGEGDAETERATAVLESEGTPKVGAYGGSQVQQMVVHTGASGEPLQPQTEGYPLTGKEKKPHMSEAKDSKDSHDDSEDLDLQATQCFVERESQNLDGALDEPWEVLATQPFCPRESEATEPQLIATHLEANGSCLSPPRATPQDQHPESPVHTEPLGIQGREIQTVEKDMGHLNYKMLPAETTSMGDPESPDACLPATMPEALALPLNSFSSQSQKHPELQSLLSPLSSSELPIPRTRYKRSQETPEPPQSSELEPFPQKPSVRPRRSSRMTPSPLSSAALELSSIAPTAQPAAPKSTSRATKGRTHKSSDKTPELQPFSPTEQPITPTPTSRVPRVKTNRSSVKIPESIVHTAPELQPSTSTDQPDTPKLTSRVTRGRTLRSSVNTPEPVLPIAPELQSFASTDQPVIPKPTSRVTRGRTCRSSVKTPEPVFSVTPELQTSTPTEQLLTSKPTFVDSQGRTHRSSVNTPEPILPTDSELQPSTSSDQPVTPQPPSRVTRGRTHRTSVKTPEPILLTGPKVQPSTSTDHQPVAPQLTSRVTRGRTLRSSVKTPETIVPTAPELQPSTSAEQPVTPKSTSWPTRGRTHRSSVKTPEVVVTTAPELQPSTSINHPITHKPTSRISRGRIHKSVETPEPVEPSASDLELPNSTDQPVASKAVCQSGALESLTLSAATLPVTPEFHPSVTTDQPVPFEPTQTSCTRRQRAAGKHGSLTALIVHKPSSAPPEPKCRSSRNQRPRAQRAAECLGTIPEPSFPQLPEAPIHASQIQKVEAAGTSGFIPEPPPKASRSRKRPSTTIDSPPLQKRPQRGDVSQETMFPKEEEEDPEEMPVKEEDIVIPDKRRRDQTEEEPKGIPSRSLRRTKSNQESAAPKVLFTGVVDARGERTVLALGGSLASSVAEASHLVTDRIRRTVKFLCALGKGIPILSLDWLHQSRKAGCFLPPDQYVVSDPEQEKNFGFNLRDALHRSRERRLLEGYEIHVTPGVQPPPSQMGEIISCCGGIVLSSMPRTYKPQRVVITCPQDFPRCSIPSRVGLPLLSPEFLLTGVLKQEAKPEAFVLSTLEMRST